MVEKYVPKFGKQGLYDPSFEHDACGVGMVANIKGVKSHSIVTQGLEVLCNLEHRGARGADPETGDGAGVLIQMPHEFFAAQCSALDIELPEAGLYAVGMTFMSPPPEEQQGIERIIRDIVEREGQVLLGWRDVPVSPNEIGSLSAQVMPAIRQFFVGRSSNVADETAFELKLYLIRRQIEEAVAHSGLDESCEFYICSLSSNKIVYKGLIRRGSSTTIWPTRTW